MHTRYNIEPPFIFNYFNNITLLFYNNLMKLTSSGGVIVFENRVLLIKRERAWVFPKGKVKENESLVETAKREILEEVGIKVNEPDRELGTTRYRYFENGEIFDKTVHYFLFFSETDEVKLEKGFLGYGWFYFDEAKKILAFKNDKKILKKAAKFILDLRA